MIRINKNNNFGLINGHYNVQLKWAFHVAYCFTFYLDIEGVNFQIILVFTSNYELTSPSHDKNNYLFKYEIYPK